MENTNIHVLPTSECPICGYITDAAMCIDSLEEDTPKCNDLNICFKCGEILVYTETLTTRLATINDLLNLPEDSAQLITRAQQMIRTQRPIK